MLRISINILFDYQFNLRSEVLSLVGHYLQNIRQPDMKVILDPRFCLAKFGLLRPLCVSRQMIDVAKKGHIK